MDSQKILMAHGSGGRASHRLIDEYLLPELRNTLLDQLDDSAKLPVSGGKILFTTDSYVIDPPFFPGGDIGSLAVYGTVNDLSVCGGTPLYLSLALILEEGFPLEQLQKIMKSVSDSAREAGVNVVTGDTKVVGRGSADKIFINTAGIASVDTEHDFSVKTVKQGDAVIVSGTIGDHGIAVMLDREGLEFKSTIVSDTAPLNSMVAGLAPEMAAIRFMRDPTRGGIATTLNEIVSHLSFGITIDEGTLPVKPEVAGASELLGLDPLYIANEGKLVAIVAHEKADRILEIIKQNRYGKDAAVIGRLTTDFPGKVE